MNHFGGLSLKLLVSFEMQVKLIYVLLLFSEAITASSST